MLCTASAVVRATVTGYRSRRTNDNRTIFTRTVFQPKEVLWAQGAAPTMAFHTLTRGGEVVEGNQKYRVIDMSAPRFVEGRDYVIFALSARKPLETTDVSIEPVQMAISNEMVTFDPPTFGPLVSGMPYEVLKREIQRVAAIKRCVPNT